MEDRLFIVGGGPAGLTAGLYASRSGLPATIYEKGYPGGLAVTTDLIDNYPGFPEGINGMELGDLMKEHAERFGARIVTGEVERIWEDGDILLSVRGENIEADAVIVATGWSPKKLGVPGEKELTGKGVSYCATCDGPLYRDKTVAVIGGGDSALQEAIFLAKFAREVKLIHRRDEFRAAPFLQEIVRDNEKIKLLLSRRVLAIKGDCEVEGVELESKKTGKREIAEAEGVFLYVGIIPNVGMLGPEFRRDAGGFIITDDRCRTSVRGVFAAGDVRSKNLRQVVTAAGDGALAAMSAYEYLEGVGRQALTDPGPAG
jgi:thioredoxin reductase (NADPH)